MGLFLVAGGAGSVTSQDFSCVVVFWDTQPDLATVVQESNDFHCAHQRSKNDRKIN